MEYDIMKICNNCRKIKGLNCNCPEKKPFEGAKHRNQELYNSTRWRKVSKGYKAKNPLCEECLKKGLTRESYYTDHIIPIEQGGDIWNDDNFQALCKKCHAIKTGKDLRKYKR